MTTGGIRFAIGDRVCIDGDEELVGTVTAVMIRHAGMLFEVSYMHGGDSKNPFVEDFRVTRAPQ